MIEEPKPMWVRQKLFYLGIQITKLQVAGCVSG